MEKRELTIKDIPVQDRPRERLIKFGPEALSNSELLAIIIRTGTKSENALSISNRLIAQNKGLEFLSSCTIQELSQIKGIGNAKAAQLKAAIELGKRLRNYRNDKIISINSPKDAAEIVMEDMRYFKKEHFRVIFLNTKNIVIDVKDLSIGNLNSSIVHPREVYSEAIKKSSASIIVLHNHPSGDPTPSQEDVNITRRLIEAGKIIGIDLLDHIIIGDGSFISLKEKGII
ncbi:DNA replication and repair protein RadC [Caloramator quimbayensis]|uniref:DNA replication and repair protein RadC n=1 Tax=Caloramator quimbayensis TaxID=1147123 RepID=A0A1T4XZS2_9CLOT|nr:DNA repair protein RadC [Caloramator quimbayensis]SKA94515.1 DNA replication and repair protein RadC [Caloramator quimbayensis]